MEQLFLYNEKNGLYDRNPNKILKDTKLYGVLTYDNYNQVLEKFDLNYAGTSIEKSLTNMDESSGKLQINRDSVNFFDNGSCVFKNFTMDIIKPFAKEETCSQINKRTQSCNGIVENFNLFGLEMNGFMLKEITFFVGENFFFIIGDESDEYLKHVVKIMDSHFFGFGFTFFILDYFSYNFENIDKMNDILEEFRGRATEQILGLKYKDIEEFNILLNKLNATTFNLQVFENELKRAVNEFQPSSIPSFDILFKTKQLNVSITEKYKKSYTNKDNPNQILESLNFEKIDKIEKQDNASEDTRRYLNGIQPTERLNYQKEELTKEKRKCECSSKEITIDGNLIKSCGEYIFDLGITICPVKNESSCNQTFQYKNNPNFFSLCDGRGNVISYSKRTFMKLLQKAGENLNERMENTKEVQNRINDSLSRSFERLEFYNSRNMSILTVISAIFLPISFLSGWYGMNLMNVPEYDYIYVYPILTTITIIIFVSYLYLYRDILFLQEVKYEQKK